MGVIIWGSLTTSPKIKITSCLDILNAIGILRYKKQSHALSEFPNLEHKIITIIFANCKNCKEIIQKEFSNRYHGFDWPEEAWEHGRTARWPDYDVVEIYDVTMLSSDTLSSKLCITSENQAALYINDLASSSFHGDIQDPLFHFPRIQPGTPGFANNRTVLLDVSKLEAIDEYEDVPQKMVQKVAEINGIKPFDIMDNDPFLNHYIYELYCKHRYLVTNEELFRQLTETCDASPIYVHSSVREIRHCRIDLEHLLPQGILKKRGYNPHHPAWLLFMSQYGHISFYAPYNLTIDGMVKKVEIAVDLGWWTRNYAKRRVTDIMRVLRQMEILRGLRGDVLSEQVSDLFHLSIKRTAHSRVH